MYCTVDLTPYYHRQHAGDDVKVGVCEVRNTKLLDKVGILNLCDSVRWQVATESIEPATMKISSVFFTFGLLCATTQAFTSTGINRQFGLTRQFATTLSMTVTKDDLIGAQGVIDKILDEKNCGPIFVRLAWHDSGKNNTVYSIILDC